MTASVLGLLKSEYWRRARAAAALVPLVSTVGAALGAVDGGDAVGSVVGVVVVGDAVGDAVGAVVVGGVVGFDVGLDVGNVGADVGLAE